MPNPTSFDVHVDAILTNMSVAYMQEADAFVASRAFPQVQVQKQSDRYFVYDQADFFRDQVQRRADGTQSAGTGYSLSTASYSAEVYALHKDIGDQTRANADDPLGEQIQLLVFFGMLQTPHLLRISKLGRTQFLRQLATCQIP